MFLTAKLNLITGMVIGATAVLAMKLMCNQRCKQREVRRQMIHRNNKLTTLQNAISRLTRLILYLSGVRPPTVNSLTQ